MRPPARWLAPTALLIAMGASTVSAQDPLPELPDYVFVVAPGEENLDVVVFGELRAAIVRFRVRINDRGFRTAWDEFCARLHGYLDADGDGVLTAVEAGRGPWSRMFSDALNSSEPPTVVDPSAIDSDPKDGKVSPRELSRYVREALGRDASGVQSGMGPDPKAQSAFVQLDLDGDGALAMSELAAADGLIRRLDADEDEMVDLAELRPNDSPFAGQFGESDPGPPPVAPGSGPLVPLTGPEVRGQVARRLMSRYDGGDSTPRDSRLSRSEFGLGEDAFRAADADVDGSIDGDELERFFANPTPSLVLDVRLGRSPRPVATIVVAGPEDLPGYLATKVKTVPEGGLVLNLDGVEIRLGINEAVRDFRKFFEMRFAEADADKDGSLDRKESEKSRFFPRLFDAADRNADDRLSHRELSAYLDRSVDATESQLLLTVADPGRNVFEILDADRDGRLGLRELRDAARCLKRIDRDGDARISLAEVPRSYQLSVGRGPFSRRGGFPMESYDSPLPERAGNGLSAVSWFQRMDRNHDGDVSPREFLGTADDFRKFDANHDGLIDAREASKGP